MKKVYVRSKALKLYKACMQNSSKTSISVLISKVLISLSICGLESLITLKRELVDETNKILLITPSHLIYPPQRRLVTL